MKVFSENMRFRSKSKFKSKSKSKELIQIGSDARSTLEIRPNGRLGGRSGDRRCNK